MNNSQFHANVPRAKAFFRTNSIMITIGLFIFVCCGSAFAALGLYNYANEVRDTAIAEQQNLTTLFSNEQVTHADLVINQTNRWNIYFANADALTGIMEQAIGGSFNDTYPADDPAGTYKKGDPIPGQINTGLAINALAQAYPDMAMSELTNLAGQMMDGAVSDQIAYSNDQKLRLDAARSFNTWRRQGMFRSFVLENIYKLPNQDLAAFVNGAFLYGEDALFYMMRPVITALTGKVYESGEQEPVLPPARE